MITLKQVFIFITVSYFLIFVVFLRSESEPEGFTKNLSAATILPTSEPNPPVSEIDDDFDQEKTYEFVNKTLAVKILEQLDVYIPFNDTFRDELKIHNYLHKTYMGFKQDDHYCDKVREMFVKFPEIVFDEKNVYICRPYASYLSNHFLQGYALQMHPDIHSGNPKEKQKIPTHDLSPLINNFWTPTSLFRYLALGKHVSCVSQATNHIPGSQRLSSKLRSAEGAIEYLQQYADRPQCLGYNKLFVDTWLIHKKEDCDAFFKKLNTKEYEALKKERRIVYMKKLPNKHRGEGVIPMNQEVETELREKYDNGKKCGEVKTPIIMQDYIHNPLLLNGNKFDFRMYMVVASTNPLIAYYHDGFMRVSLMNYDINSDDKKVLLTNLALNHEITDAAKSGKKFMGMDEEEVRHAQRWSFERLQNYLLEKRLISDPNWLDNYLRPEFKKAYIHLIRMAFKKYFVNSSIYELFGVDFMLDTNFNIWFIEANDGPAFSGYSVPIEKHVMGMLRDHFRIIHGLLRSRMKRVMDYVNTLITTNDYTISNRGNLHMKDLESKRAHFAKITRNYFEKEFEIGPENGFSKIIDENYEGAEAYQGYLPKGCL
jgi:tubulin polyglutamylase TTLL1